jgi:hypothetical protein
MAADATAAWLLQRPRWSGGYDLDGHLDVEGGTILKTALQGPG